MGCWFFVSKSFYYFGEYQHLIYSETSNLLKPKKGKLVNMSCLIDNNTFELAITPSRKRKRENLESGKFDTPLGTHQPSTEGTPVAACFTNAAFSSTPKKAIGKRLLRKENRNPFLTNPCLEVKSIADIAQRHQKNLDVDEIKNEDSIPENPYEVVRKPPKKKKRRTEIEEACFENPALNLELPEKQFNPFEVNEEALGLKVFLSTQKKEFIFLGKEF